MFDTTVIDIDETTACQTYSYPLSSKRLTQFLKTRREIKGYCPPTSLYLWFNPIFNNREKTGGLTVLNLGIILQTDTKKNNRFHFMSVYKERKQPFRQFTTFFLKRLIQFLQTQQIKQRFFVFLQLSSYNLQLIRMTLSLETGCFPTLV